MNIIKNAADLYRGLLSLQLCVQIVQLVARNGQQLPRIIPQFRHSAIPQLFVIIYLFRKMDVVQ